MQKNIELPLSPPNIDGTCSFNSSITNLFYSDYLSRILALDIAHFTKNLKLKSNIYDSSIINLLRLIFIHYKKHASSEYNFVKNKNAQRFVNPLFSIHLLKKLNVFDDVCYMYNTNVMILLFTHIFNKKWIKFDSKSLLEKTNTNSNVQKFKNTNLIFHFLTHHNYKENFNAEIFYTLYTNKKRVHDSLSEFIEYINGRKTLFSHFFMSKNKDVYDDYDVVIIKIKKEEIHHFKHIYNVLSLHYALDSCHIHLRDKNESTGHVISGITYKGKYFIVENQIYNFRLYESLSRKILFNDKIGCVLIEENWKDFFINCRKMNNDDHILCKKNTNYENISKSIHNSNSKQYQKERHEFLKNLCHINFEYNYQNNTNRKCMQDVTFYFVSKKSLSKSTSKDNLTISSRVLKDRLERYSHFQQPIFIEIKKLEENYS